jgi:hypothetical protein
MSYPVKLAQITRKILQRVNLEGAYGRLISGNEMTELVNAGLAKWYDEVRATTWNGAYYRAPFTFNTTPPAAPPNPAVNPPANAVYPLPTDFLSLTSVDGYVSPSCVISGKPFQEEDRNMYRFWNGLTGWYAGMDLFYQIQGAGSSGAPYIVLMPPPSAVYQVQVNYVPTAPILSDPEDSFDSINSWDEMIVEYCAIQLLKKTGRTAEIPFHQQLMQEEVQRIRKMARRRDMQGSERVHEVNSDYDFYDGLY